MLGKWIRYGEHVTCNHCGVVICDTDKEGNEIPLKFCPSCGVRMIYVEEMSCKNTANC